MLHLIFQAPIDSAVLERIAAGDDVVFLDSAVLGLLKKGRLADTLRDLSLRNPLFVVEEDIAARGISAAELAEGLIAIDYAQLVGLTVKNTVIQSWC